MAQAFFALLASTPAHAGRYQPRIEHTDDYPDLQIALTTDLGPVLFFSQSQGTHHTPWGLTIAGVSYIVDVETPNRALVLLSPYLDYEKQELLLDKVLYGNTTTVPSALALCSPATASSRPATTVPNTPPRDLVALYQLEQTYSLVITGTGVGPIAQEQKLVRDPDRLATLLTALKQPTAQTARPGRYNDDLKNTIYLNWRTSEGRRVTLTYDPVVGILSYYEGNWGAYYAVPPAFAAALRSHLCLPALPQTGG